MRLCVPEGSGRHYWKIVDSCVLASLSCTGCPSGSQHLDTDAPRSQAMIFSILVPAGAVPSMQDILKTGERVFPPSGTRSAQGRHKVIERES